MTCPDSLQLVPTPTPFVDITDHINSWNHAKEYTMAGMSGIHVGMYKAQIRHPDLALYDAALWLIPYNNGLFYDQWHKGVDVMLLKASGNTHSDKLALSSSSWKQIQYE